VARRVKKRAKRKPEIELTVSDYQVPGEKRIYWEGVGGLIAIFAIVIYNITYFGVFNENAPGAPLYHAYWVPVVVAVFPVLTWVVANMVTLRPRNQRLKEGGLNSRVLNKNYPKLKAILAEQTKLLAIDEPEMYVLDEGTPYMYSLPGKTGKIVTTDAMLSALNDEEIAIMMAREMGHIKAKHARMMTVITGMRRANAIVKVLLFPITGLSMFLRGWAELAEATADRMAVLIAGRPAPINAALVKLAVASDNEAEISKSELEAYLDVGSDLATDADQIERHFKMGEFLGRHQSLKERIEEVRGYFGTDEGQAALQKMTEIRQKLG